jgi:integrase
MSWNEVSIHPTLNSSLDLATLFLFYIGCRPTEAIALKWKHSEKNCIHFCEAVVTDVRIRKVTKTDELCYFPINQELRRIFDTIRPELIRFNEYSSGGYDYLAEKLDSRPYHVEEFLRTYAKLLRGAIEQNPSWQEPVP